MKLVEFKTNVSNFKIMPHLATLHKDGDRFYLKNLSKYHTYAKILENDFVFKTSLEDKNGEHMIQRYMLADPGQVIIASQGHRLVAFVVDENYNAKEIANINDPFDIHYSVDFENVELNQLNKGFVKTITSAAASFEGNKLHDYMMNNYRLSTNQCILIPHDEWFITKFYRLNISNNKLQKICIPRQHIVTCCTNSHKNFLPVTTNEVVYAIRDDAKQPNYVLFRNGSTIANQSTPFDNETLLSNATHVTPIDVDFTNLYIEDDVQCDVRKQGF